MNIFYTNQDPILAANDHCNVHVNKMVVEYAQLLSTAHHILDQDSAVSGIYKCTHKNHPSAIWCRSGQYQYEWVLDCAMQLCKLYKVRTGKGHKTFAVLKVLRDLPNNMLLTVWQDPPVAAPDEFKKIAIFGSVTDAYRQYMISKFQEWQQRDRPIKVEFIHKPIWLKM
ncbi:hypothetical protein NVP1170O_098 [Vibrio phage 1.170.O._10N.261.52.C3]|nr:hypothetical protein NVP1170O_098 [Vibrio phage 1.170.O._10N.261.52.C3]